MRLCFFWCSLMLIVLASVADSAPLVAETYFSEEPLWINSCSSTAAKVESHGNKTIMKSIKTNSLAALSTTAKKVVNFINQLNFYNESETKVEEWSTHFQNYTFLPKKIKPNKPLKKFITVHKFTQIYLASFQYLAEAHNQTCYRNNNCERSDQKSITKDLTKIKEHLKNLLCEMETYINTTSSTSPTSATSVKFISLKAMQNKLMFHVNAKQDIDRAFALVNLMHFMNDLVKKTKKQNCREIYHKMKNPKNNPNNPNNPKNKNLRTKWTKCTQKGWYEKDSKPILKKKRDSQAKKQKTILKSQ